MNIFFPLLQDVHHGNGTQEIFEQNKSVSLTNSMDVFSLILEALDAISYFFL